MKTLLTLFFILATFYLVTGQTTETTYYVDDNAVNFVMGKMLYESKGYSDNYEKDRIEGINLLTKSANGGLSDAQYYLGTIYLNDTLIQDKNKAIELLRKSAYQGNEDAILLLDRLGVDYQVKIDYKLWCRIGIFSFLALLYLALSLLAYFRVSKSNMITLNHKKRLKYLLWILPYFGAILGMAKSKKILIPLDSEKRDWIANSFEWITKEFGIDTILNCEMVLPIKDSIPVIIDYSEKSAIELFYFVAEKMKVDKNNIEIDFYNQSPMELDRNIITQGYDDVNYSTGQYWGKTQEGKYLISIEKSQLKNPIGLIATIAHELAHVKLLGEKRLQNNNEYLTDLIPIVFGFGIFNANSIFQFQQDPYSWKAKAQGYLDERMYGFALATFAKLRNEIRPEWSKYLTLTINEEFERSLIFLENN